MEVRQHKMMWLIYKGISLGKAAGLVPGRRVYRGDWHPPFSSTSSLSLFSFSVAFLKWHLTQTRSDDRPSPASAAYPTSANSWIQNSDTPNCPILSAPGARSENILTVSLSKNGTSIWGSGSQTFLCSHEFRNENLTVSYFGWCGHSMKIDTGLQFPFSLKWKTIMQNVTSQKWEKCQPFWLK